MKRRRVLISQDAEAQLEAIRSWWLANRPAAPDLFDRELDAAVAALGKAAQAFALYRFDADAEIRLRSRVQASPPLGHSLASILKAGAFHTERSTYALPPG